MTFAHISRLICSGGLSAEVYSAGGMGGGGGALTDVDLSALAGAYQRNGYEFHLLVDGEALLLELSTSAFDDAVDCVAPSFDSFGSQLSAFLHPFESAGVRLHFRFATCGISRVLQEQYLARRSRQEEYKAEVFDEFRIVVVVVVVLVVVVVGTADVVSLVSPVYRLLSLVVGTHTYPVRSCPVFRFRLPLTHSRTARTLCSLVAPFFNPTHRVASSSTATAR
jgi:hypothetical protein